MEEVEKDSDLLRLWRTTLERISPLKLSTALCLSLPLANTNDGVSVQPFIRSLLGLRQSLDFTFYYFWLMEDPKCDLSG